MIKKKIIIVGYPKSGTTWLSRLVAELVSCPLQGDWGFEELDAPYKEGLNRKSKFQVYKSHHTFGEIGKVSKHEIFKIIYIVRDPRDVVISGIHYFSFLPRLLAEKGNKPKINRILRKTYNKLVSKKEKKRQLIDAVLNGNKNINTWFTTSWNEHATPYTENEILIIKYEDLLSSTEIESRKILNYLGVEKTTFHLKKSIENQSFQNRKKQDFEKKDSHQKNNLRTGKTENWKTELTEKEKNLFQNKLKNLNTPYDF